MALPQQLRFVGLPDGRRIAYREMGCSTQCPQTKKTLLVLHGLLSSRRIGMPGATDELLQKYGVRLVAIDRPGYGQSDPHYDQTFESTAKDIEYMMDKLDLGDKISLLGFSMGGAYCWGAARYIPERLDDIALAAPVGNFWWKSLREADREAIVNSFSLTDRITSVFMKNTPFSMAEIYGKVMSAVLLNPSLDVTVNLSEPDRKCFQRPGVTEFFRIDREESLRRNSGFGLAKDYKLINKGWDFDLPDIRREFAGKKIHIWQGVQDTVVPFRLQKCVHELIPDIVNLNKLDNHGHFSWFCFDPQASIEILETLFAEKTTTASSTKT